MADSISWVIEDGLREVSVIVGLLTAPHRSRPPLVIIPEPLFLCDLPPPRKDLDLALNLIIQGLLKKSEGVQILYFDFRSEFFRSLGSHGNIGVTAQAPFLHVPVTNAQVN
jgi:hypothetical protein